MRIPSDSQIRADVLRELRQETRLSERQITVEVNKAVVTLTGTVASTAEQTIAYEAAQRASDVFAVISSLEVRTPSETRTDEEIAQEVARALEWDVMLPHERIRFEVSNGWVSLSGDVDYLHEREGAERHVRRLAGVRGVYNQIEVSPREARPENVREAIAHELRQRAQREAESIRVSLNEGVVILSGQVHSWEVGRAIIAAASQAPGVQVVKDQLRISPQF